MANLISDLLHIRLLYVARASLWPWWYLDSRTRHWVLWANDREGASVTVGRRRLALRPGRTVLLPPDMDFTTAPGRDVQQVYASIEMLGLPRAVIPLLAPGPVDLGDDPVLAAMARHFHATLGDQRAGAAPGHEEVVPALAAKAWAHQALARLLAQASPAARAALGEAADRTSPVAPALRHMEAHLADAIAVDELARRCGMGAQWFTRQFRRATGHAPAHYLMERRCAVAAQRLTYSDEAIDAIANACGFADRAYFTRVFTRLRGVPPARFRSEERERLGFHNR